MEIPCNRLSFPSGAGCESLPIKEEKSAKSYPLDSPAIEEFQNETQNCNFTLICVSTSQLPFVAVIYRVVVWAGQADRQLENRFLRKCAGQRRVIIPLINKILPE